MNHIQAAARVGAFVIQCRWHFAVFQSQQAADHFNSTRTSVKVAEVALQSSHGNPFGQRAKRLVVRLSLIHI